jgi:hypothetical protein
MMHIVISICGAIWIVGGFLLWTMAHWVNQQILGCMLLSFGVAFLGIAVVIRAISRLPGLANASDREKPEVPSNYQRDAHGVAS